MAWDRRASPGPPVPAPAPSPPCVSVIRPSTAVTSKARRPPQRHPPRRSVARPAVPPWIDERLRNITGCPHACCQSCSAYAPTSPAPATPGSAPRRRAASRTARCSPPAATVARRCWVPPNPRVADLALHRRRPPTSATPPTAPRPPQHGPTRSPPHPATQGSDAPHHLDTPRPLSRAHGRTTTPASTVPPAAVSPSGFIAHFYHLHTALSSPPPYHVLNSQPSWQGDGALVFCSFVALPHLRGGEGGVRGCKLWCRRKKGPLTLTLSPLRGARGLERGAGRGDWSGWARGLQGRLVGGGRGDRADSS